MHLALCVHASPSFFRSDASSVASLYECIYITATFFYFFIKNRMKYVETELAKRRGLLSEKKSDHLYGFFFVFYPNL